jgi:hypothetical protein
LISHDHVGVESSRRSSRRVHPCRPPSIVTLGVSIKTIVPKPALAAR